MYTLKKHNIEGGYEVYDVNRDVIFRGSLNNLEESSWELGLVSKDITFALEMMEKKNHQFAEFGMLGKFLYSHNNGVIEVDQAC